MKKIIFLLCISILNGCQSKEVTNTSSSFTEEDAYEVMNTFIKDQEDQPVLWNNRQLIGPPIEYTTVSFDEIPEIPFYPELTFPVFTKKYWKPEKLENIIPFDSKEYDYFFAKKNKAEKIKEEWQTRFKDNYLYNVSYPLYNEKSKVVIIDVYYYKIPLYCGTGLHQTYFYKKTANGWRKPIDKDIYSGNCD